MFFFYHFCAASTDLLFHYSFYESARLSLTGPRELKWEKVERCIHFFFHLCCVLIIPMPTPQDCTGEEAPRLLPTATTGTPSHCDNTFFDRAEMPQISRSKVHPISFFQLCCMVIIPCLSPGLQWHRGSALTPHCQHINTLLSP